MNTPKTTQPTTDPRAQRHIHAAAPDVSNPAREAARHSKSTELQVTAHTSALTYSQTASDLRFYRQPLMPNQEAHSVGVAA